MPEFQTALFVCTGNIYRSRFAEAWFNCRAEAEELEWRAESRGFRPRPAPDGLSPEASEGLLSRGIARRHTRTFAAGLKHSDLAGASVVILLKESEHQPMLAKHFPEWVGRVRCWDIHDIAVEGPEVALPKLEARLNDLVDLLVDGHALAGGDAVAMEF